MYIIINGFITRFFNCNSQEKTLIFYCFLESLYYTFIGFYIDQERILLLTTIFGFFIIAPILIFKDLKLCGLYFPATTLFKLKQKLKKAVQFKSKSEIKSYEATKKLFLLEKKL